MSPYKAVFGEEIYVGMEVLNLPEEEKNKIKNVQQLFAILGNLFYSLPRDFTFINWQLHIQGKLNVDDEFYNDDEENNIESIADELVSDELLRIRLDLATNTINPVVEEITENEEEVQEVESDQQQVIPLEIDTRIALIEEARANCVIGQERTVNKK